MTMAGCRMVLVVEVISVPPPTGNLAITSAERRDRRIVASIQNYGNSEVRAPVRLIAGGREIAKVTSTMAARGAADARIDRHRCPRAVTPKFASMMRRVISPTTCARSLLDPAPAVPIAVVVADPTGSTGGLYVERALDGGRQRPRVRRRCARRTRGAQRGPRPNGRVSRRCSCSARARSIATVVRRSGTT